jgi:hypothetical protein
MQTTYLNGATYLNPLDIHKELKRKNIEIGKAGITSSLGQVADYDLLHWNHWLPQASEAYHISNKIEDYILVPIIALNSDLPNRNCVSFPVEELLSFDTESGLLGYETLRRMPTFADHVNADITKAKGVILDAALKPLNNSGVYKLLELLSFDRSKDGALVADIMTNRVNTYSIGSWVKKYTCSYCGADLGKCDHLHPTQRQDLYLLNGKVVFRECRGINFFETSAITTDTPAFPIATSDTIILT